MAPMTTTGVPTFTLGDRMWKARRHAEISTAEMASFLSVTRKTINNYEQERTTVPGAVLRVWAMRCGVPYEWLLSGDAGPDGGNAQSRWMTRAKKPRRDATVHQLAA